MKIASIRGRGLSKNIIFNSLDKSNRDNCFDPYIKLKQKLKENNICLSTYDCNEDKKVDFELHHDVQPTSRSSLNYLLLLETKYTYPANSDMRNLTGYRKIFTWQDDIVDGKKFIKIYLPNPISIPAIDGWSNRSFFCCLIASNKALYKSDANDLYIERIKTIKWFEKNAPQDFNLYGLNWNIPAYGRGLAGKVSRKLFDLLSRFIQFNYFPSYQGAISQKREVYIKTKYAICYENVSNVPGYITEKIFDAFFSGCVPIYWGAHNIHEYIPKNCYIDRKNFKNTKDLYEHLKSISEVKYLEYQHNIRNFLTSDAGYKFSSENFANTIVDTIVQDIRVST